MLLRGPSSSTLQSPGARPSDSLVDPFSLPPLRVLAVSQPLSYPHSRSRYLTKRYLSKYIPRRNPAGCVTRRSTSEISPSEPFETLDEGRRGELVSYFHNQCAAPRNWRTSRVLNVPPHNIGIHSPTAMVTCRLSRVTVFTAHTCAMNIQARRARPRRRRRRVAAALLCVEHIEVHKYVFAFFSLGAANVRKLDPSVSLVPLPFHPFAVLSSPVSPVHPLRFLSMAARPFRSYVRPSAHPFVPILLRDLVPLPSPGIRVATPAFRATLFVPDARSLLDIAMCLAGAPCDRILSTRVRQSERGRSAAAGSCD